MRTWTYLFVLAPASHCPERLPLQPPLGPSLIELQLVLFHPTEALAHLGPVFPYDAVQLVDALAHQTALSRLNDSGVSLHSRPSAPLHYSYDVGSQTGRGSVHLSNAVQPIGDEGPASAKVVVLGCEVGLESAQSSDVLLRQAQAPESFLSVAQSAPAVSYGY